MPDVRSSLVRSSCNKLAHESIKHWHSIVFLSPHSIGYPFVAFGFGFKSYVNYKMRLRKQEEVAKENELCMRFMQITPPPSTPAALDQRAAIIICNSSASTSVEYSNLAIAPKAATNSSSNQNIQSNHSTNSSHKQNKAASLNSNGTAHHHAHQNHQSNQHNNSNESTKDHQQNKENVKEINKEATQHNSQPTLPQSKPSVNNVVETAKKLTASNNCIAKNELQLMDHHIQKKPLNVNDLNEQTEEKLKTGNKNIGNVLSSSHNSPTNSGNSSSTAAAIFPNSSQNLVLSSSPINNERRGSGGTNTSNNKWPNSNSFNETLEKPKNSNQQPTQSSKQNASNHHNGHTAKSQVADLSSTSNNQINHIGNNSNVKNNSSARSRSSSSVSSADVASNSSNTQQNNHRSGNHSSNVFGGAAQRRNKNNSTHAINNPVKEENISK